MFQQRIVFDDSHFFHATASGRLLQSNATTPRSSSTAHQTATSVHLTAERANTSTTTEACAKCDLVVFHRSHISQSSRFSRCTRLTLLNMQVEENRRYIDESQQQTADGDSYVFFRAETGRNSAGSGLCLRLERYFSNI